MEYILKITEEANRRLANDQQQESGDSYMSVFCIGGEPILPPLLTPERRLEMQNYRHLAMELEQRLQQQRREQVTTLDKGHVDTKHANEAFKQPPMRIAGGQSYQFADASTNTDLSLSVLGKSKQQLQRSETLIYDNKCNAIIKPMRADSVVQHGRMARRPEQLVREEEPVVWAQGAVGHQLPQTFAMLHTRWMENERSRSSQTNLAKEPSEADPFSSTRTDKQLSIEHKARRTPAADHDKQCSSKQTNLIECTCRRCKHCHCLQQVRLAGTGAPSDDDSVDLDVSGSKSIMFLMTATRQLQLELAGKEPLHRATTSPMLKGVDSFTGPNLNRTSSTDHTDKLSPLLWRRCRSYPLEVGETMPPYAEGERSMPMNLSHGSNHLGRTMSTAAVHGPTLAPTTSSKPLCEPQRQTRPVSKIEIKQRMAPGGNGNGNSNMVTKSKSRCITNLSSRQPNLGSTKTINGASTPNISYAAHASSHIKSQANNAPASCAKRRLSYDPRASLRRSNNQQKKSNNNNPYAVASKPQPAASPSLSKRRQAASPSLVSMHDDQVEKVQVQPRPPTPPPKATMSSSSAESMNASPASSPPPSKQRHKRTESLKRKMIGQLELQQRRRFQQLVTEQATQQKRLQLEFESQQQQLIDQMLHDMAPFGQNATGAAEQPKPEDSLSCSTLSSASYPSLLPRPGRPDEDSDEREPDAEAEAEAEAPEEPEAVTTDIYLLETDSDSSIN